MAAEGMAGAGIGSADAGAATVAAMVSVFCGVNKSSYKNPIHGLFTISKCYVNVLMASTMHYNAQK